MSAEIYRNISHKYITQISNHSYYPDIFGGLYSQSYFFSYMSATNITTIGFYFISFYAFNFFFIYELYHIQISTEISHKLPIADRPLIFMEFYYIKKNNNNFYLFFIFNIYTINLSAIRN